MSLTYTESNERGASRSGRNDRRLAALARTSVGCVKQAGAAIARALGRFVQATSEARMHRAAIEIELYHRHFILSSKNDDDLPVVIAAQAQPAPSFLSARLRAFGSWTLATLKRIYPAALMLTGATLLLAAMIAMGIFIWVPIH